MTESIFVLLAAFLLDMKLGDPVYSWHPVRLLGNSISGLERLLRRPGLPGEKGGIILVVLMITMSLTVSLGLMIGAARAVTPLAAVVPAVFLLYSCLGLKDLFVHAVPVADALRDQDLDLARERVQRIVGRDVTCLDTHGVARAAVETVAENFVDAFLAPVFWYVTGCLLTGILGGPPVMGGIALAVVHRAANTMDAMVGYKNERYLQFGRAAARFDDVMNFLPARLSLPLLSASALFRGLKAKTALATGLKDRLKHASPNAGHAESVVAGALGIRLGGPTTYPFGVTRKPWLGTGTPDAEPSHIRQCCGLAHAAGWGAIGLAFLILFLCRH